MDEPLQRAAPAHLTLAIEECHGVTCPSSDYCTLFRQYVEATRKGILLELRSEHTLAVGSASVISAPTSRETQASQRRNFPAPWVIRPQKRRNKEGQARDPVREALEDFPEPLALVWLRPRTEVW